MGCVCDRILSRSVGCVVLAGRSGREAPYPFWAGLVAFRRWGEVWEFLGLKGKGGKWVKRGFWRLV